MAHFTRFRRLAHRPTRSRSTGWQLVGLTTRLAVVIFAVVVCLTRWGPAQERSPKSGPATPTARPTTPASAAPSTPPPPAESNVPVRTAEGASVSQPPSGQPTASDTPATPGTKPAKAHRTIPTRPLEIIEALGVPFIIAFGICSVITVWFSIERLVVLRRGRVIPRPFVERFLQNLEQGNLDPDEAMRLCDENGSPIAQIFAHGVRKWGKSSVEVEQAIIDGGERQVSQLRAHLRVLNAVAVITPLLGLLGTVIGMIQCFNDIAASQGMGKADQLAGGIGIALLATAAGLFVAIPSLSMYQFLSGRVDALTVDLDLLSQNIVHLVSAEALADGSQPAGRPKTRRAAAPESKERKAV
ncbi:MAG TPA: MotA/TolQ/ExbB proton channel family protein [Planctomycetaceae bacterium]|nr:MotA/TolQ/ExbB proton channel family protein [Planctomycetaceae bacterium]